MAWPSMPSAIRLLLVTIALVTGHSTAVRGADRQYLYQQLPLQPSPGGSTAAGITYSEPFAIGTAAGGGQARPLALAPGGPLRCNRRLYTYRISQSDSAGRECWDHVSVWSCFGRCDSKEISNWKFPYKLSYHPVCVHAGRTKAVAQLRQCDADVEPGTERYEYMEAVECRCQTCSSSDTRCEAPNHVPDESAVRVLALAGGPSSNDLEYD